MPFRFIPTGVGRLSIFRASMPSNAVHPHERGAVATIRHKLTHFAMHFSRSRLSFPLQTLPNQGQTLKIHRHPPSVTVTKYGESLLRSRRIKKHGRALRDFAFDLQPQALTDARGQVPDEDARLGLDHPAGELATETRLDGGHDQDDDGASP